MTRLREPVPIRAAITVASFRPTGWVGYAKDHQIAAAGTVAAIGMRAYPAGSNLTTIGGFSGLGALRTSQMRPTFFTHAAAILFTVLRLRA